VAFVETVALYAFAISLNENEKQLDNNNNDNSQLAYLVGVVEWVSQFRSAVVVAARSPT
jgi:hypothetical protein